MSITATSMADKSKEVEFVSSIGGTKRLSFHYLKSDETSIYFDHKTIPRRGEFFSLTYSEFKPWIAPNLQTEGTLYAISFQIDILQYI